MELSLPLPRRLKVGGSPPRQAQRRGAGSRAAGTGASGAASRARGWALAWRPTNRLALRAVLCALLAVPLLGGGWLWLRDSSLVSVRHVHIAGVQGVDAIQIRTALDAAAARMTTLDFNAAALRTAVAEYPVVAGLRVRTSFPHTVSIAVSERPPVAALLGAGQRTAVAADGTVLGPALLSGSLPTISASSDPIAGARVREAAALGAVTVLAAAPAELERFVVRAYNGPQGLTVALRTGLLVYFGNATRPHAKWLSLARVLVSPSASGASYVDVRLPERPAAGFSSTSTSSSSSPSGSSTSTSTAAQGSASSETAATLAASLEAAVGGGSTASTTPAPTNPVEAAASSGGEAPSASPTGTGVAAHAGETPTSASGSATGGEASTSALGSASTPEASSAATGGAASAPATGG
jgi:cell division protein FtsQ